MATLDRDIGRKVEWAAVDHFDTGHPHVHIVVRGVDRDGRELRIDRGYISAGMRWRAQELATEELGPRPERDVQRAQEREVTQRRFTTLDRELERRGPDHRVEVRVRARSGRIEESLVIARLEHLEGLRLAERVSRTSWRLVEGWQTRLRDLGSRGDILHQIHAAVRGDPSRYDAVRPGEALRPEPGATSAVVMGRVAGKGLSDELKGTFYAVVETPTGRAYHVPLDPRGAQTVSVGDLVSLATPPETSIRPTDRKIAEAARARGGVFAIDPSADGDPQALARRLRELERVGLVAGEGPGRWKVPPDLLERLAERGRDAPPRYRLVVRKEPLSLKEQVVQRGPVWLDRVETKTLAHWGLGADVRQAVAERREAMRRLGIGPDDPDQFAKLRELERRGLGGEIAGRSGLTFLARVPEDFRGRIQPVERAGPPSAYTVVSDGERFVVLQSTPALRDVLGAEEEPVDVVEEVRHVPPLQQTLQLRNQSQGCDRIDLDANSRAGEGFRNWLHQRRPFTRTCREYSRFREPSPRHGATPDDAAQHRVGQLVGNGFHRTRSLDRTSETAATWRHACGPPDRAGQYHGSRRNRPPLGWVDGLGAGRERTSRRVTIRACVRSKLATRTAS